MGASLDSRTFPVNDKETIKELWANAVTESRYEDGTYYSGVVGMLGNKIDWRDIKLADESAARSYIEEHSDKWSGAMAVSFIARKPPTAADKITADSCRQLATKAELERQKLVLEAIKGIKVNDFVTCKGEGACKSRIATKFIHSTLCPFCRASFIGFRLQSKLTKLNEEIIRLNKKAQELSEGAETLGGWVVGGICPS